MRSISTGMKQAAAAAGSGLLLTAAFPDCDLSLAAWIALVPLLVAVKGTRPATGFRIGFIAGLVHYTTLLYWVAYTMNIYGHLPLTLCIPLLFLFAAYLAIYIGAFASMAAALFRGPALCPLLLPIPWVALEYLRSTLFTGFPWELLGYSQYKVLPIIQGADLFGVYGVSFLIVLVNAAAFQALKLTSESKGPGKAAAPRTRYGWGSVGAAALIFAAAWFYGTARMAGMDRRAASADTVPVAVVQGNIDQAVKWNKAFQKSTAEKYVRLSRTQLPHGPALIVWPETATPFYFLHDTALTRIVLEGIREVGVDFLLGSNTVEPANGGYRFYNSAYLITPEGAVSGRYDKTHLVPYGEYVPLKKWMPFIGKMVEHVGDFKAGRKGATLPWKGTPLGILICYEIIFPDLSRHLANNGAALLINLTNDAWYGRTSAPYQHFSMAVFRAVENRRAIARSANTGISGFIDPVGRIMAATSLYEDAAMTRDLPWLRVTTLYHRIGDLFAVLCLACTGAMVIWTAVRRHNLKRNGGGNPRGH